MIPPNIQLRNSSPQDILIAAFKRYRGSGRPGGICRHWRSLVRFLIVRTGNQGEMRTDAHFRRYGARMRLIADPGIAIFCVRTIRKHPSAAPPQIPPGLPPPILTEYSSPNALDRTATNTMRILTKSSSSLIVKSGKNNRQGSTSLRLKRRPTQGCASNPHYLTRIIPA